ncbi:MAG: helix-turn-helix domain-containing protein [Eubacteriales bacterium]
MKKKTIVLSSEAELRIFMEPLRQRILRTMDIAGTPMTAKKLADTLKITPSSAKHHLLKLEQIGLVEKDHTEQIHGITAVFYALTPVSVSIGLYQEDFPVERGAVIQNLLASIYGSFLEKMPKKHPDPDTQPFWGDLMTGVLHLTQSQAEELNRTIQTFIAENDQKKPETHAFEFALILYNTEKTDEAQV